MKIINKDGYLTKKAAFVLQYMLSNNIAKHDISLKNGRAVNVKEAIDLLNKYWYDDHLKCMEEGKDGYSIVGLESLYDKTQFSLVSNVLFKDTHQENGQFTEEAAKIVFDMVIGGAVAGGLRCRNNNEIHDILGTKQVKSKYPYRINGFAYSPTLGFYVNETAQSDIVGFVTKTEKSSNAAGSIIVLLSTRRHIRNRKLRNPNIRVQLRPFSKTAQDTITFGGLHEDSKCRLLYGMTNPST